jgi:hypothetical protein
METCRGIQPTRNPDVETYRGYGVLADPYIGAGLSSACESLITTGTLSPSSTTELFGNLTTGRVVELGDSNACINQER